MQIQKFESAQDLKVLLAGEYMKQITNFFQDQKQALKFLSSVMAAVQRTPKLLECEPGTVINSFMTMAQLGLMPSDVSGEAYVLPYKNKGHMEAQFQLGYQGLVTLFFRSGVVKDIVAEIVYENDEFSYKNGEISHEPDVFADDRGAAKGAYVIVRLMTGGSVVKVMSKKDILHIAQKFSKSFKSDYSPWKEANDPQLWMWRKTVLTQTAKLVPKNETLTHAIAEDYKDSTIADKPLNLSPGEDMAKALTMGKVQKDYDENQDEGQDQNAEGPSDQQGDAGNTGQ